MNSYKVIDIHSHIFPNKIASKAVSAIGDFYMLNMSGGLGTPEDIIESGKKINVYKYIVHSVATIPKQVESINTFIKEQQDLHPEFIGFGTLHPFSDTLSEDIEYVFKLGLRGVKVHPDFQSFDIDDPKAFRLYKAIEGKLPILIHMGDETRDYSSPARLRRVIEMFPRLVVIAAHFGGYQRWNDSRKYLIGQNVYFDTSSSLFKLHPDEAADIIHEHGVDKILYGTDYPMWAHADEFARLLNLPITEEEHKKILYDNSAKLLNIL